MKITEHRLKIQMPYYEAIKRGDKLFEVRKDDRAFQRGDKLLLKPMDGDADATGEFGILSCFITFVLPGGQFGIEPGYVVLGIKPQEEIV